MTLQETPAGEQLIDLFAEPILPEYLRFVFQGLIWPDAGALRSQASESAPGDFDLLDDTIAWIGRVLKPEWLAPDLRSRLLAAKAIIGGRDAFLARYSIDGTKIQIIVDRFFIHLVISPAGESLAFDAARAAREFLRVDQPGDETLWPSEPWSITGIEDFTFGYHPSSFLRDWRDSLNYLSNGRAVKFSVKKVKTRSPDPRNRDKYRSGPSEEVERHWFDQPPNRIEY